VLIPDIELPFAVDSCLKILAKMKGDQIFREIGDLFWVKIMELKNSVRTCLVNPISPNVYFLLSLFAGYRAHQQRYTSQCSSPS